MFKNKKKNKSNQVRIEKRRTRKDGKWYVWIPMGTTFGLYTGRYKKGRKYLGEKICTKYIKK